MDRRTLYPRATILATAVALLPGCDDDTRARSLLDELKLVAITTYETNDTDGDPSTEVTEVAPGQLQTVRTLVADPISPGTPLEYAVIACTSYTGVTGCLEEAQLVTVDDLENLETNGLELDEADYHSYFDQFVRRGSTTGDGISTLFEDTFTVPSNYDYLMTYFGYPELEASVTVLVCRPGLCPILDEIDAFKAYDPNALKGEDLFLAISQPDALLSGLPVEGVAMGRKSYLVSNDDLDRNQNPRFASDLEIDCGDAASSTEAALRTCDITASLPSGVLETYTPNSSSSTTQEAVVLRFYSTAGAIDPYSVQITPSNPLSRSAVLTLPAVEDTPDRIAVYVVAEDSRDGMGYTQVILEP